MEEKQLEILIVEDKEENRKAAKEFFDTIKDIKIDFAEDYEEALQKLEEKQYMYAGAIIDVEIPRKKGQEPEKLGLELGDILDSNGVKHIPKVLLTSFFHGRPMSRTFLDSFCYQHSNGESGYGKNTPEAYKTAYGQLLNICSIKTMREILRAKVSIHKCSK